MYLTCSYKKLISRWEYLNWLYCLTIETNPNPNHKPSYSKLLVPVKSKHDHHKKELYWLPVTYRTEYKATLLTYMVHDNRCLQYLRGSVVSAGSEPEWYDSVKPPNSIYWNSLIPFLQQICTLGMLNVCWYLHFCSNLRKHRFAVFVGVGH